MFIKKVRPQMMVALLTIGAIAVIAMFLNEPDIALATSGGVVAVATRLVDKDDPA